MITLVLPSDAVYLASILAHDDDDKRLLIEGVDSEPKIVLQHSRLTALYVEFSIIVNVLVFRQSPQKLQ